MPPANPGACLYHHALWLPHTADMLGLGKHARHAQLVLRTWGLMGWLLRNGQVIRDILEEQLADLRVLQPGLLGLEQHLLCLGKLAGRGAQRHAGAPLRAHRAGVKAVLLPVWVRFETDVTMAAAETLVRLPWCSARLQLAPSREEGKAGLTECSPLINPKQAPRTTSGQQAAPALPSLQPGSSKAGLPSQDGLRVPPGTHHARKLAQVRSEIAAPACRLRAATASCSPGCNSQNSPPRCRWPVASPLMQSAQQPWLG